MSIRYAFVTLLTSDAYLQGALTIVAALKDVHSLLPSDQTVEYETVCLVTPETVDVTSIRLLRKAFNVVVGIEIIVPPDTESLTLLGACSSLAFYTSRVHTHGVSSTTSAWWLNSFAYECLPAFSPHPEHGSMQRCFLLSYHSLDLLVTFFQSDVAVLVL